MQPPVYRKFTLLLLALCFSVFGHAQWDWEEDSVSTIQASDGEGQTSKLLNLGSIRSQVMADISELERPEWHASYANLLADLPKELEKNKLVIYDWPIWDSLLTATVNEFSKNSSFNREHTILILRDAETNAFATEGGLIAANVGLLADAQSFDEIRLVLAHEMGHVHYHHPYHSYVKQRIAQNRAAAAQAVGLVLGGVTGYLITYGATAAIYADLMSHSRADESEADDFAGKTLHEFNYSVANGVRFYEYIGRSYEKFKLQTGKNFTGGLYGSSHPAPLARHDTLMNTYGSVARASHNPSDPEVFIQLRDKARLEKLRILNAQGKYRECVEFGWHYLIKDLDNIAIKESMIAALEKIRDNHNISFLRGVVLTDEYSINESLKERVNNGDISSDEAKNFIRSMLLMTDNKGDTPFPLNVTFSQLHQLLLAQTGQISKLEAGFLDAISYGRFDRAFIEDYVKQNGKYVDYANFLLDPSSVTFDRTVFIPVNLELNTVSYPPMAYGETYKMSDWSILKKKLIKEYPNIEILNFQYDEQIEPEYRESLKALTSLMGQDYGVYKMDVDLLNIDPGIGDWLVKNRINTVILADYLENRGRVNMQIQRVDIENKQVKQIHYKIKSGTLNSKYVPKRFGKYYKKLAKKNARTIG